MAIPGAANSFTLDQLLDMPIEQLLRLEITSSHPPQLAALIRTNVNVQELTVEAALTGRVDHIYHAAMLDPHTAAELDLDQITALVDALLVAHGPWIPR